MKNKILSLALLLFAAATAATAQSMSAGNWWGYYTDGAPRGDMGTSEAETYSAAIFVPGTDADLVGKAIDKVRLYIRQTEYIKDLSFWLSTKLPPRVALANVLFQPVDLSTIKGGNEGEDAGLPNEIRLDEPYVLTSKGVWVGYTLTVTHVESDYDWDYASPLVTAHGMDSQVNASMFMTSQTITDWFAGAYILPWCNFCTQVHVVDAGTLGVAPAALYGSATSLPQRCYDLQGRPAKTDSGQRRGVYIVSGRKVVY